MTLLCILVIGVLQGIHGIKYFTYPIDLLETVNKRSEFQSKEEDSEIRGDKVLTHVVDDSSEMNDQNDEKFNENNAKQAEYKEFIENNLEKKGNKKENKKSNERNVEQVDTKEFNQTNVKAVEPKEFNGRNAKLFEFKEDNVVRKNIVRTSDDTKIDAIMTFLKGHMLSTNYFYTEVKRIKERGVVYDSLRKMAAYLEANPKFKKSVLDCFHVAKVVQNENVAMWSQKPNNLVIDLMQNHNRH